MRLDRPIGTWLLFWPCVFGLVLGAMADERSFTEWRDLYYVVLFGIGTVVMRGAGCTFNDIIDRKIDAPGGAHPRPPDSVGRDQRARRRCCSLIALCLVGLADPAAVQPGSP